LCISVTIKEFLSSICFFFSFLHFIHQIHSSIISIELSLLRSSINIFLRFRSPTHHHQLHQPIKGHLHWTFKMQFIKLAVSLLPFVSLGLAQDQDTSMLITVPVDLGDSVQFLFETLCSSACNDAWNQTVAETAVCAWCDTMILSPSGMSPSYTSTRYFFLITR